MIIFSKECENLEKQLRSTLNTMLNNRNIKRYLTADEQVFIFSEVTKLFGEAGLAVPMHKDILKFFDANETININYD